MSRTLFNGVMNDMTLPNSDFIHVLDSAGNFNSDNVEGALGEVGSEIKIARGSENSLNDRLYYQGQIKFINLFANSDFNGTTSWSNSGYSVLTASNNVLSITGNGVNGYPRAGQSITPYISGKKIYIKVTCKVTNAVCRDIAVIATASGMATTINILQSKPVQDTVYTRSTIITLPSGGSGNVSIAIAHGYESSAAANGNVMEVQSAIAVDLLSAFGTGEEPSKGATDAIVTQWFSGTQIKDAVDTKILINDTDYPSYVDTEAADVIERLYTIQNEGTVSIAFITDLHNGDTYTDFPTENNKLSIKHALAGMGEISKKAGIDFLCLGGDYVLNNTTNTTKLDCFAQLNDLRGKVSKYVGNIPKFWLRGNHDINPVTVDYTQRLTPYEILTRTGKTDRDDSFVINNAEKDAMYGYVDLSRHKLRLVFLDLYRHISAQTITINNHGISTAETHWILGNALNLSSKSDFADWGIVIFSHVPTYAGYANETGLKNGIAAAQAGTSVVFDSITYDYTAQGATTVIAGIGGDGHYDNSAVVDGLLTVMTQNAGLASTIYAALPEGAIKYIKTPGTADETSFDIFTIDRTNGKLYATRYGAGIDRVWDI